MIVKSAIVAERIGVLRAISQNVLSPLCEIEFGGSGPRLPAQTRWMWRGSPSQVDPEDKLPPEIGPAGDRLGVSGKDDPRSAFRSALDVSRNRCLSFSAAAAHLQAHRKARFTRRPGVSAERVEACSIPFLRTTGRLRQIHPFRAGRRVDWSTGA